MQMFVLDFPLSRPIYFLAFRLTTFIFDFFRLFSWRFSSAFFYRWSHLLQTHSCVFEKWWNMAGLILSFVSLLFVAQCCAVLQQGNAAWARRCYWELLLFVSHNKLGVLLSYQKTIVLDVFLAVSCHLNFTFSRGIMPPDSCSPLPQVAHSAHALQDLYLISPFISKELLKIYRLIKRCILRWKKLNVEYNGPSAQSVSILFVQEASSNYYFYRGHKYKQTAL